MTLVQLVLFSQPIYQISYIDLLRCKLNKINKNIRALFWQASEDKRKFSLLSRDQVIDNTSVQGLAFGARLI